MHEQTLHIALMGLSVGMATLLKETPLCDDDFPRVFVDEDAFDPDLFCDCDIAIVDTSLPGINGSLSEISDALIIRDTLGKNEYGAVVVVANAEDIETWGDELSLVEAIWMHDSGRKFARFEFQRVVSRVQDAINGMLAELSIETAASTDPLTGLYNRRHFYRTLENYEGERVTLVIVDLDDFKPINDEYGHAEGDEALKITASLLQEEFPGSIVTRWGGDEFLVTFTGEQTLSEVREKANDLVGCLPGISMELGKPWKLHGSAGIAVSENMHDIDDLIRKADEALYLAKRMGKGRSYVYRPRDAEMYARLMAEGR